MGLQMDTGKRLNVKIDNTSSNSDSNFNYELQAQLMKYNHNGSKVDKPLTEQTKEVCWNDGGEIDIIDCIESDANELVEVQREDTTESSSSSFGDSDSNNDNLVDEAISGLHGDVDSALNFHGDMSMPRKKQLTLHWKASRRPLMWRCKWAELQVKKLEAQARKYERQLAKYNQQEHVQLGSSTQENIAVKSLPYSQLNSNNKLLKRKKRRKTETTTDLRAYMSTHKFFSYYENWKSINGAMVKAKNQATAGQKDKVEENLCASKGLLWPKPEEDNYSVEQMLQKIMSLESRVGEMKDRVGKVITENSGEFSNLESLSPLMPNDSALIGSSHYRTTPFPNIGGRAHIGGSSSSSHYNTEPYAGIASTSYAHEVPDSTRNENLAYFPDVLKHGQGGVLAANLIGKQETNNFDALGNWLMQRPMVSGDEPGSSSTALMEEPDSSYEDELPPLQDLLSQLEGTAGDEEKPLVWGTRG